jgi:hypothetical protein
METLNLADNIAQLKVLKWQYDETKKLDPPESTDARHDIIRNILKTIENLDVPQLIGTMDPNEYS